MRNRTWGIGIVVVLLSATSVLALRHNTSSDWFIEYPFPLTETHRLFDIGVVDANGDGLLDIYTSNHHFRQALLMADGQGGYQDKLSEWGLDQSPQFPLAELSFVAPPIDIPGLYIYWYGTRVVLRTFATSETRDWNGTLKINEPIKIIKNDGFSIKKKEHARGTTVETTLEFSTNSDAMLVLHPGGQGLPLNFHLSDGNPLSQVYVGRGRVSPTSRQFSLSMQDRHAFAWADYNDDGYLDFFATRGALGGGLRAYPEEVAARVQDELLVRQTDGAFTNIVSNVGISKRGCSGRHARWLDFNQDGFLDLFVNCYDRGNVAGRYPKQLYRQDTDGHFRDVAAETGIAMPDQQLGSLAWIDVDNDRDTDLVAFQDEGIFLYRNHFGVFSKQVLYQAPSVGAIKVGQDQSDSVLFDGKLSVADFDADGDLDLFAASKRGNVLLSNHDGSYESIEPQSIGLPARSITANWVDYDNDGFPDLHAIPQGIFRGGKEHVFEATGLLAYPKDQYTAAICNWFDLDNDGRIDVVMAFGVNRSFRQWWQFSPVKWPAVTYPIEAYRNVGARNHWLQIELNGGKGNPQALGAQVAVVTPNGQQVQEVGSTDGAFFSQGHYRLYFGLGTHEKADLKIRWPDGAEQEVKDTAADKLLFIERDNDSQSG